MCLGVPGKVLEVDDLVASVDFFGLKRQIRLDIVDEPVKPGDYILNHVGFAIRRIPDEEIDETLELYEMLLQAAEDDMMAEDVRGEIAAGEEAPPPKSPLDPPFLKGGTPPPSRELPHPPESPEKGRGEETT